jgi:hypothetical protein
LHQVALKIEKNHLERAVLSTELKVRLSVHHLACFATLTSCSPVVAQALQDLQGISYVCKLEGSGVFCCRDHQDRQYIVMQARRAALALAFDRQRPRVSAQRRADN